MKKLIIAAGALVIASATAQAGSSGGYGYQPVGQGYYNSSKIIQSNVERYGRRTAWGNDAYTAQLGKYNKNVTVQSGDGNYQYLFQNGYLNNNQTWQFGYKNSHIGVQDGIKNNAVVAQKGLYNKGKTFQFGLKNDARIIQAGRVSFMKPKLHMHLAVKKRPTAAFFKKLIVKPGTIAVGGGYWAPRKH
ncbi:MAG: hypothetical protein JXQ99_17470 [Hyphomicrobiaceae bacterium]